MTNLSIFKQFVPLCSSNKEAIQRLFLLQCRCSSRHDNTIKNEALEKHRVSPLNAEKENIDLDQSFKDFKVKQDLPVVNMFREKYPEFLPDPQWRNRDRISERLEREDMHRRRQMIDIPEFYVGSILAVTVADKFAPGKSNRFVGICIHRSGHGLRHQFILRNAIDEQGIEVMYEMYNPLVLKIEVLALQKRLDDELFYLRDCPLKYSYFPQDMEVQKLHDEHKVPIDNTMVELGPRPWSQRWERFDLKGVHEFKGWKNEHVYKKAMKKKEHPLVKKEWEKDDIMKHYRESINPVESAHIFKELNQKSKNWVKKKTRK